MNNINPDSKSYVSHFLEYITAFIFVGVSSTSWGIYESLGSEAAQEVVFFPHKTLFHLELPCFHPAI